MKKLDARDSFSRPVRASSRIGRLCCPLSDPAYSLPSETR